jgi:tetratricopeptide (TPR) repeat protein
LLGCVYESLGMPDKAREKFTEATKGDSNPVQAIYYNDPQPDKIFYQALAFRKLGKLDKANSIFESFLKFGEAQKDKPVRIDYFAVSLPDMLVFEVDINRRNEIFCKYLIGLGYIGSGEYQLGEKNLDEVIALDKNHQGAATHLRMIPGIEQMKGNYVGN